MGGDPQAMGAERSHRAPPVGHSRSAPVSWVLATASWITTVDHKRIGILYGVTAFAFFLLGGLEALLIRLQLAAPDAHVVSAETYNALFTMHGTTMVFLAIMPLNAAFFNYMVPLLIGARDVAFPRLNALSYWIFLFGGLFLNASFLVGTPPDVGWFGYANLTSKQFSPSHSVDFWLLSLQLLGVSSMIAAINFIVTILNMRPPAMRLMRMPVFVWMTLVVQFLIVLAFPPITVGLIFLMFDRFFGSHFYDVAAGGDLHLWQHLFWIFGHPEVYILILPAFGIVSEVLPTFARKPLFGAPVVVYSGVLIGFFAGAYYWWPKITGRLLGERLGKLQFWVLFAGFNTTFFPQHYLGAIGMPRRIYTYAGATGWTLWNAVSTVGAFGIAAGVLLFMVNAWWSLRAGASAPADPWDGRTLEWRTSSPPPPHDFDTIPPVLGRDTFWREKYGPRGAPPAPTHDHIHLPAPSHWPVVVGLGMAVLAVGALTHLTIVLMGALVTIVGIFRLALEHHRTPAHEHQTGGLGLDHRKVALWVFLGSECFFFGTLIATYLAYRGRSVVGPEPHEILNIPLTTVSTFDLLMSSLLMVLALAAVERDDRRHARLWLFGTAFFGLIFLAFQAWEFTQFVREGLTLQQNLFGSTFFVLTGFHGAHVAVGVVWLLSLWLLDLRGRLGVADAVKVEIAGLYWHFVDIVWIVIFT